MRYFDAGNSVSMDACAVQSRDYENTSIMEYNMFNFFYPDGDCRGVNDKIQSISLDNPNLHFRNGYGVTAPCTVDDDNKLRYSSEMTHGPEKRQYNTRNFQAGPNIAKGPGAPTTESLLQQGVDTTMLRECDRITARDFGRFIPFQPCMSSYISKFADALPQTQAIGQNSRDMVRSREYLQKCGLQYRMTE